MKKSIILLSFILISMMFYCENSKASEGRIAYLTFDDGPTHNTEKILDILDAEGIKGTFFVIGSYVEKRPDLIKRLDEEGHYIGLHSMSHNRSKLYYEKNSPQHFLNEILEQQALIYSISGFHSVLVRPPYSDGYKLSDKHIEKLVHHGFKVWDWNIDTRDWCARNEYEVHKQIKQELKLKKYPNKIVVLMHEHSLSVKTLPSVIKLLRKEGYTRFEAYDPHYHFPVNIRPNACLR